MTSNVIRIGTRGSLLATTQSGIVRDALRERGGEDVAALRQRITQQAGHVYVRVELVDDPHRERVAQRGLFDERTDCAHVGVGIEDE